MPTTTSLKSHSGILGKKDLQYGHYVWTTYRSDDPRISGIPDRTPFDRSEGMQMLYIINKMLDIHGLTLKQHALKIERMIQDHLPSYVRSQEEVMTWVLVNW